MAKQEQGFCEICGKITYFEWQCDQDSDPDEPSFFMQCVSCGRQIPPEQLKDATEGFKMPLRAI